MADRPHPSSIAGGPYDGTTFSYIPGDTLNIDPSLILHRDFTDKIDPITYEVIRHNLWNINEELGMTIQRISGSPVAMYAFDLNSSIFTEDGEFIYYGPYQLYMSGVSDVQVKWTLEHRSNNPGKKRILHLIQRYGADVVKGVMRKIIDTAEQAFVAKLAKVPDGTWRERSYVEVAYVGDRKTYQVMLTMRKQGDKLFFDNAGTAPQVGAINTTYSGWRGSLMTAINELLCWDQLYAIGGALRHIEFRPALGCFTSATHPASVSTAPVQAMEISLYPAYNTISKMLSCDPELKRDVMTIGGTSQFPLTVFRGIDQWGEKFGYLLLDPMVGAIGAFSFKDGIATGGQVRSPICRIGNVEHNEQSFPLLVLYRKENTDSGGAGKFRGGNSAAVAFIPHGTTHITQDTESSGAALPTAPGLAGGYPATTNYYQFKRNSDILERHAQRRLIGDISEAQGQDELLQLRQIDIHQGPADVYEVAFAAGAGYGDPIGRDPQAGGKEGYLRDISLRAGREIFKVGLTGEGEELRVGGPARATPR